MSLTVYRLQPDIGPGNNIIRAIDSVQKKTSTAYAPHLSQLPVANYKCTGCEFPLSSCRHVHGLIPGTYTIQQLLIVFYNILLKEELLISLFMVLLSLFFL